MKELEPTITERRRLTRNSIYQLIFRSKEPVSKQEIANSLGYSLPTVHQNISELMDAGLICVGTVKQSTGGRPPVGYEICPDVKFSVGASITANHLRFLACNLKQEEIAYRSIDVTNFDVETVGGAQIKDELRRFLSDYHLDPERMLGLGVTIPGIFDEKSDTIVLSPTLQAKNISMRKFMEESDFPVLVMNDSTSAGAAELLHRREDGKSGDFVCLTLENGVGGAIFYGGRQYEGVNLRSAEFGHMRIVPDGRLCNCGQRGCLEAYVSAFRYTRDMGMTIDEFFTKLREGDEKCRECWEDVLDHLALGIINLRMAFDCDVILGGFTTEYMKDYLPDLRSRVSKLDTFGGDGSFVKLSFNPRAAMYGAAWKFTENFIQTI